MKTLPLFLSFLLGIANAYVSSFDQINIKFDFSRPPVHPKDMDLLHKQDPNFKHLFKEVSSNHLMLDHEKGEYVQVHCTNFIDVSDTVRASPVEAGWGTKPLNSQVYSMIDDEQIEEMIEDVEGLTGIPELRRRSMDHLKFNNVSDEVGSQLLAPLYGQCFDELIDIWYYKFCVGDSVDQYNTNDSDERYNIGKLNPPLDLVDSEPAKTFDSSKDFPMNLQKSKNLQNLKKFLGSSASQDQKEENWEEMIQLEEYLQVEESGRIIRIIISPKGRDFFNPIEYYYIQRQLGDNQNYATLFNIRIPSQEAKNMNDYFSKLALQYQIQSQNASHFELLFIFGDEEPLPRNFTLVDKYETSDFNHQPIDLAPNPNWVYEISRYFDVMVDGIIVCHSSASPNIYDPAVCNLEAEYNQGDTLVYTNQGLHYHGQIERFITPSILQMVQKQIVANDPPESWENAAETQTTTSSDDEGFNDEPNVEVEREPNDFNKVTSMIVEPPFFVVDSMDGQIEWKPEFDRNLAATKPLLQIKGDQRYVAFTSSPIQHLLEVGDYIFFTELAANHTGEDALTGLVPAKHSNPIFQITQFKLENNEMQILLKLISGTPSLEPSNPYIMSEPTNSYLFGRPFEKPVKAKKLGSIFNRDIPYMNLEELIKKKSTPAPVALENGQITKMSLFKQYHITSIKLQFRLLSGNDTLLEFTFNQDYGIIIKTPTSEAEKFLDLNIFNSQKQTDLYIILYENRIYLSVQGLTFNDIIYSEEMPTTENMKYILQFDEQYHQGISKFQVDSFKLNGENVTQQEKEYIKTNFDLYASLKAGQMDLKSSKNVYVQEYTSGSICEVHKQPRRIVIFFYCDEFAGYQNLDAEILDDYGLNDLEKEVNLASDQKQELTAEAAAQAKRKRESRLKFQRDFRLLELSEPDWCVYHAKVATRFMCGASNINIQSALKSERKTLRKNTVQYSQNNLNNTVTASSVEFEDHTQEVLCAPTLVFE